MIKLICAVDRNFGIGYKSSLLFEIPDDLKRFRNLTQGGIVVQGRVTYESIVKKLGNPLPNRINCVLTRNKKIELPVRVFKSDSVEKIINHYTESGKQDKDLWIIGGQQVYDAFLPHADEVLITYIDAEAPKADTHFDREALEKDFFISGSEKHYCEHNGIDFYYVTYIRK